MNLNINKIIKQLDTIALEHNIIQHQLTNYSLDNIIESFNKLEKYTSLIDKKKLNKVQELMVTLEIEVCEKKTNNVDNIFNKLLKYCENETYETKLECSQHFYKIINNNILNQNIKNKLIQFVTYFNDKFSMNNYKLHNVQK